MRSLLNPLLFLTGCFPLCRGDSKTRTAGLFQGVLGQWGWWAMGERLGWVSLDLTSLPSGVSTQGLIPAGIRLVPHTVLTFMFLEQLRKHFGIKVPT